MTDTNDILELDDRRFKATIAADIAALGDLFAEDLVYTHSNGFVDSKQSYLDAIAAKKFDYEDVRRFDQHVRLHGDTALVTA